ncbi:MAG TPA: hypothetical protein VFB21_25210 [Chthonomonadaceae bacterium]|nr:hypothetical protein [Chthonomonadaceae bacterium]
MIVRKNPLLTSLLAAGACCALPAPASAATLSFTPSPADLSDLDHHSVYTWRINGINLNGQTITGASLSFKDIRNWDSNPNVLHLHLLDTAKTGGVSSFVDDPNGTTPETDYTDDFISTRYHSDPHWLVSSGTADTFLIDKSFTTTPINYTYNFTSAQLQTLATYIQHGNNVALGFDPDCHFYNDGVTFQIKTADVPEPGAMALFVGLGVSSLHCLLRRRRMGARP